MQDALNSIHRVSAATQVLEPGIGPDIARVLPVNSGLDTAVENSKREALASAAEFDRKIGPDIRGRRMVDDVNDFFATAKQEMVSIPMGSPEADPDVWNGRQMQRQRMLQAYWNYYPSLTHNRDVWQNFLSRNHLPATTPHSDNVLMTERALLAALRSGIPTKEWAENAQLLLNAYIDERKKLVRPSVPLPSDYRSRISPCPAASTETSGTRSPKYGRMTRSLEDFWPVDSKRLGEEGTVLVSLKISATGCVTGAAIAGSSGFDMLDAAVLQAFETMEFIPAGVNGAAVESTATAPIVFKLKR
jgi:TonB family protein